MRTSILCATLAIACRGDKRSEGLPPASEWHVSGSAEPATRGTGAVTATDYPARFTTCLVDQLAEDPIASANAMTIFARAAPAADARVVLAGVARQADRFPAGAQAKILGEAAWALVTAGDINAARAAASRAVALPPDGNGGRLTALATLGRIGAIDDATALATDMMALDAVAFGAAVGGHRDEAVRLRTEIEGDPAAQLFVRSAIHLKLVAALGDVPVITHALADRDAPSLLLDAGAVVEGGSHAGNAAVMMAGVTAIAEARGVSPARLAEALIGAAGTAAAVRARSVVDAAIAAFDALPAPMRAGLELVPAVAYATAGAPDEARRRFAAESPGTNPVDRAMVGAGLAARAGRWSEIPSRLPTSPVLTADIWGLALAANLDAATRAHVLDAVCPR